MVANNAKGRVNKQRKIHCITFPGADWFAISLLLALNTKNPRRYEPRITTPERIHKVRLSKAAKDSKESITAAGSQFRIQKKLSIPKFTS